MNLKNKNCLSSRRRKDDRYHFNLINYKNEKNKIFVKSLESLREIAKLTIFNSSILLLFSFDFN